MDAIKAIKTRRSVREYSDQHVADETIRDLLEAAMCAPSAGNEQPWHFIVIRDQGVLEEIPRVHPYALMVKKASAALVVCGDTRLEKHKGFWVQDCAAATENILLAANAKGLGAVWLGIYPRKDRVLGMQKLLKLPEEVIPLALVPLGYPLSRLPGSERFNESRIHEDRW
ncbi:MAG: nitroreductase family protein [Candidatus Altiarchaeota archaeon]|nr:nitroreductase family protein [Candidatus Altiarchaeota archaeon]